MSTNAPLTLSDIFSNSTLTKKSDSKPGIEFVITLLILAFMITCTACWLRNLRNHVAAPNEENLEEELNDEDLYENEEEDDEEGNILQQMSSCFSNCRR